MRHGSDDVLFSVPLSTGRSVDVYGPPPAGARPNPQVVQAGEKRLEDRLGLNRLRRRGAHDGYNCHGLTFMGKLGWIGFLTPQEQPLALPFDSADLLATKAAAAADEEIKALLMHLGYVRTGFLDLKKSGLSLSLPDVMPGDIALYKDYRPREDAYRLTHSAIVLHVEETANSVKDIRILSKFGMLGEYVHSVRAHPPELGDQLEIWSDRGRGTRHEC